MTDKKQDHLAASSGQARAEWTPGPWQTNGHPVVFAGKRTVAYFDVSGQNDQENRANARFAASAPALYEALKELLATRNAFAGMAELVEAGAFADTEARAAAIEKALAALSAAEGKEPP
jgi:hypothetical protein